MKDDFLAARGLVENDGRTTDFGPGAGRCRNGYDGSDPLSVGLFPVVADIFEGPQGQCLSGDEPDRLRRVHRRAAADANYAVAVLCEVFDHAGIDLAPGRIAVDLVVEGLAQPRFRQHRFRPVNEVELGNAAVSHQ